MNLKSLNKDKPEALENLVKNAEAADTIPAGSPVALVLNGTDDGLAVVLPKTATAVKGHTLNYGVALGPIAVGQRGRAQAYGFCRNTVTVVRTRSASDANWASTAAGAVGDPLIIDTANNAFKRASIPAVDVTGTAGSDTIARDFNMFAPLAVLAQTLGSASTVASTAEDTRLVSTALVKTFLRML
jgi:hypothetical protein